MLKFAQQRHFMGFSSPIKSSDLSRPLSILAIESSCDDTSAAVVQDGKILANRVANQTVHQEFGGVVPELASRAHQKNIIPVVHAALADAGLTTAELDAVAFTQGPGLLGSLLVGTSFAKGLALSLGVPLIGVHHMRAHILAHFITERDGSSNLPPLPFLCLTVSGGHTQLVVVRSATDMEVIGQTIDDAVGEAFDKAAKILGLPYPGGPVVDKLAREGNPTAFDFAKPAIDGLDFSFSGIKTSFLYFLQKQKAANPTFIEEHTADLCASIQRNLIEILMDKLTAAVKQTGITAVAIAGGVSANSQLRHCLNLMQEQRGWQVFIPKFEYCTDNAAMIAMAGYLHYKEGDVATQATAPSARLPF